MVARILITLALVWQTLVLPAPVGTARHTTACPPSCCQVIERVTCCGERIVEHVCAESGGACHCGASTEAPERGPRAPMPQSERGTLVAIRAPAPSLVFCKGLAPRMPFGAGGRFADGMSHNQAQAFLGIWRT